MNNRDLEKSYTAYKSWGKGAKLSLRFSKSGTPHIEQAYATHFIKPKPKQHSTSIDVI